MGYDVTLARTAECPTAVVKATTTPQEFPALWRGMLDDVWGFVRATPGLWTAGHNVMLYGPGDRGLAVEVGVQVTRTFEAHGRVVPSTLPSTEAATTVHSGPIAQIGEAHDAVQAWCAAQGRDLTGVSWEVYGDPDPQTGDFDVTVYWQVA